MESVVKNCGQTVHDEVANKQTMEELKEILKVNRFILLSFIFLMEKQQQQEEMYMSSLVYFLGKEQKGNWKCTSEKSKLSCGVKE